MKATIDTNAKTITIDCQITLDELITELDKLFPDGTWRQFMIITPVYYYPITIYPTYPIYPTWPTYPTYPIITCSSQTINT